MEMINKKIIALSCSPSKGRNSDYMLDYFINGAKTKGLEIEKIYLEDIYIETYQYENSKGPLANEPEFKKLVGKIQRSDGLIISTPTYNFSVPAHLKNFVDRIGFISLDYSKNNLLGQPTGQLKKLRIFFLVSGGTPKILQKFLFFMFPVFWLRAVFMYYGAYKIGSFYSGDKKTYENEKILNKCRKLGGKFANKFK